MRLEKGEGLVGANLFAQNSLRVRMNSHLQMRQRRVGTLLCPRGFNTAWAGKSAHPTTGIIAARLDIFRKVR